MTFAASARKLVTGLGEGPLFVHSDAFRTARLVAPTKNKLELLNAHVATLRAMSEGRGLWMPAFNYDFPRTGTFDVARDPSQLGPIPEHYRATSAAWRTPTPMFSVSGEGANPSIAWGDNTNPFGADSIFGKLVEHDGVVVYYGDTFAFNTIVHYAEHRAGLPLYRYDKTFPGTVIMTDCSKADGSLRCHVRPLGKNLDYDWPRLFAEALDAGVCKPVDNAPEVTAASARALSGFWIDAIARDPLYLLDDESRNWVEPLLDKLGRRFTITDFEEPMPAADRT